MIKIILLLTTVCVYFGTANAQEGTPSVNIFSNFNYDMSAEEGEEPFKEFEIKRSYLGYSYKIDDKFSTKIKLIIINSQTNKTSYQDYTKFKKNFDGVGVPYAI